MMTKQSFLAVCVLTFSLVGCGTSTPYFLIESHRFESPREAAFPEVTETPTFRSVRARVWKLGLRPPDVCADQGLSGSGGRGQLQLGVMRMRCGVEMAQFERALAQAGYEVVSWSALQQRAMGREKPLLEAAAELGVDVLLQVNALERIDIKPPRDARWERRFYEATRSGEQRDPASVEPSLAGAFEELIEKKESPFGSGRRVGAMINVSAVFVESGSTIWFYEWTLVDDVVADPQVEMLVDCDDYRCVEVPRSGPVALQGPVEGSISSVSTSGDPVDQAQAIFSGLLRDLATDLAERFAGRRT